MWEEFTPLPLTVPHHPLEPATSLISRLAARNGVASVTDFCRDIGFPYKALVRGDRNAIVQLARLAGCDVDALCRFSVRNLGRECHRRHHTRHEAENGRVNSTAAPR